MPSLQCYLLLHPNNKLIKLTEGYCDLLQPHEGTLCTTKRPCAMLRPCFLPPASAVEVIDSVPLFCLSAWVCKCHVVHHLNSTGQRCAPPTCVVHHQPALCIMVHKRDLCTTHVSGAERSSVQLKWWYPM